MKKTEQKIPYRMNEKETIEKYNKESLVYDRTRYGGIDSRHVRTDEEICHDLLTLLRKGSVLELGSGTGRYGIFLKENGFEWTGIEISKGMIEKALEKNKILNIINGNVTDKKLYSLNNYDNVICIKAFNFFPEPKKVMRNVYNTLKSGSKFILFYYNKDFFSYFHPVTLDFVPYTLKFIREIALDSGFTKVSKKRDIGNFPLSFYQLFPNLSIKNPVKWIDNHLRRGWISEIIAEK